MKTSNLVFCFSICIFPAIPFSPNKYSIMLCITSLMFQIKLFFLVHYTFIPLHYNRTAENQIYILYSNVQYPHSTVNTNSFARRSGKVFKEKLQIGKEINVGKNQIIVDKLLFCFASLLVSFFRTIEVAFKLLPEICECVSYRQQKRRFHTIEHFKMKNFSLRSQIPYETFC